MSRFGISLRRSIVALAVVGATLLTTQGAGRADAVRTTALRDAPALVTSAVARTTAVTGEAGPQATAHGWSLRSVPPPTTTGGSLAAISCSGPQSCMAVGDYTDGTGGQAPLAETWNGWAWSVVPTVNPRSAVGSSLSAVSCPTAGFCVAAGTWTAVNGQDFPLTERWRGGRWSMLATPNPVTSQHTYLTGVACTSAASCIAVGYVVNPVYVVSLAEAWDGHRWSVLRTANVLNPTSPVWGVLNGIWCVSANACTAVGYYDSSVAQLTLAERWNGRTWSVVPTPSLPVGESGAGLNGVTCRSARECVAVGNYFGSDGHPSGPLAESWNGRTWSIVRAPAPVGAQVSYLVSAACPSARVCVAVGYAATGNTFQTLAEQWNGTTWSIRHAPPPAGSVSAELTGVWCRSALACTAVGNYTNAIATRTLGEAWTGSAWAATTTPNPVVPEASRLDGISCPAPDRCVAAGDYTNASVTGALSELWNGTAWSVLPAPSPAGMEEAGFSGVSCPAANYCVAAGSSFNGTTDVTLAEVWNGTSWSIMPTPNVNGAQSTILTAISCAVPGRCVAVGYYSTPAYSKTLAEMWNGHAWRISKTPNPAGSGFTSLFGTSCPAVNRCTAVGSYSTVSANVALAMRWNGSTWAIQSVPTPAGMAASILLGVSCPSVTHCTAAGNYYNGTAAVPLAEAWNGTAWSAQLTPAPGGWLYSTLTGVSCPAAGACAAVGYGTHAYITSTLAAAWDGRSWAFQPSQNPANTQQSYLNSVSCAQPGTCAAVGSYLKSPFAIALPLAASYQR